MLVEYARLNQVVKELKDFCKQGARGFSAVVVIDNAENLLVPPIPILCQVRRCDHNSNSPLPREHRHFCVHKATCKARRYEIPSQAPPSDAVLLVNQNDCAG